jgi:hypothetical protein
MLIMLVFIDIIMDLFKHGHFDYIYTVEFRKHSILFIVISWLI